VTCALCERIARGELVAGNDLAVAFFDAYPVTPGHCLVLPRRHEPDFLR
jgi:histidine triad (HIT) family protein